MTNAEKFKEIFGYEIHAYPLTCICALTKDIECPNIGKINPCHHCEYNSSWWDNEYKPPEIRCCDKYEEGD